MKRNIIFVAFLALISQNARGQEQEDKIVDDTFLDFTEWTGKYGFDSEIHEVTTEDGYQLSLWRIPGLSPNLSSSPVGKDESQILQKPPILFMHGLVDSAYCFMNNYAEVAPAFTAARAGYDVWLANSRGNTYSKKHAWLDLAGKDAKEFWDFSWSDMGLYDLPAIFDYIENQTGFEKVAYVAHSMGNTQMLYNLSLEDSKKNLSKRIAVYIAISPVAKLTYADAPLITAAIIGYDVIEFLGKTFGLYEFAAPSQTTHKINSKICDSAPWICNFTTEMIATKSTEYLNQDRMTVMTANYPAGSSVKSLKHFGQVNIMDKFQEFCPKFTTFLHLKDERDCKEIKLDSIKEVPIGIFKGKVDTLSTQEDVAWLRDQLADNVKIYKEMDGGHLVPLIGKDMSYFTDDAMDLIKQYHPVKKEPTEMASQDSLSPFRVLKYAIEDIF